MSFIHDINNKEYLSIRDKIQDCNDILNNPHRISEHTCAKRKLERLNKLDSRNFSKNPDLIITNDKFFGNNTAKLRVGVAIKETKKGDKVLVAPIYKNKDNKVIILDKRDGNNSLRRVSNNAYGKNKWIPKEEIYETHYVPNVKRLTIYDKDKIKEIYK